MILLSLFIFELLKSLFTFGHDRFSLRVIIIDQWQLTILTFFGAGHANIQRGHQARHLL